MHRIDRWQTVAGGTQSFNATRDVSLRYGRHRHCTYSWGITWYIFHNTTSSRQLTGIIKAAQIPYTFVLLAGWGPSLAYAASRDGALCSGLIFNTWLGLWFITWLLAKVICWAPGVNHHYDKLTNVAGYCTWQGTNWCAEKAVCIVIICNQMRTVLASWQQYDITNKPSVYSSASLYAQQ